MSDLEFPSEEKRLEDLEKTDDELAEESRKAGEGIVSLQDSAGMELFLRQLDRSERDEEEDD